MKSMRKKKASDKPLPHKSLRPDDVKKLRTFGIKEDLIGRSGIFRATDKEARVFGFKYAPTANLSGIVFPYFDGSGQLCNARIRRDHPDLDDHGEETQNKYISLPSTYRRGFFWPPGDLAALEKDRSRELVQVEAEKSALAGTAWAERGGHPYTFFATGGCDGWSRNPDLEILRGRSLHVLMDTNVLSNDRVRKAEREFAAHAILDLQAKVSVRRLPLERDVNGLDDYLARHKDADFLKLLRISPVEPWLAEVGESYDRYKNAKRPDFAIEYFLPSEGATLVGGLSGHSKTFILLSIVQSLLTGNKLFGYFRVERPARRVIYLTPEIGLGAFKHRAEKFNLGLYVETGRLLVRTLSAYPMLKLDDPRLLLSAQGADVFLDTVIRFVEGDESSSSDNDRGLADGIFRLLSPGARTVTGAAHSPKSFETATYMSLENVLRGSGDIGAMASAAWGVRMVDRTHTRVQVENIKARDFEAPPPFQIQGRPHIDHGKGLQMFLEPGACESLKQYVKDGVGRKKDPAKAERRALLEQMVKEKKTREEIAAAVKEHGWNIASSTLDKEIRQAKPTKF
jgi:hypothetical protein